MGHICLYVGCDILMLMFNVCSLVLMFLAMVPGQILTERFSGMIVARFKNQKSRFRIQKPKCTIQKPKWQQPKLKRFRKKNVPIQKPRKERDSETKKYDSTCTIQKPKFDLETSTWLLPPLTTMLHFEHHRRSKPRQHPSDHYVAFGTSQEIHTLPPLWPLGCILNFTRDQNSSVPL